MSYTSLRERFCWDLPARFNMGAACSDAHPADDPALISEAADGSVRVTTFGEVARRSDRLAAHLRSLGVDRADRIGVIVPQSEATRSRPPRHLEAGGDLGSPGLTVRTRRLAYRRGTRRWRR